MAKKIIFFLYTLILTLASQWPSDGLPSFAFFPHADKLVHIGMYAGFTFLLFWAWPQQFSGRRQFLPAIIVIGYGFFMEFLQRYGNLGRSFEFRDEMANAAGIFPGWLCWRWLVKPKASKDRSG
jgi:VanZ family protein